jgi:hypothetical protein
MTEAAMVLLSLRLRVTSQKNEEKEIIFLAVRKGGRRVCGF